VVCGCPEVAGDRWWTPGGSVPRSHHEVHGEDSERGLVVAAGPADGSRVVRSMVVVSLVLCRSG